jgi:hypothetical protein
MYCPKCKMMLIGDDGSSYHIHDIIEHEEDFKNNIIDLSKEQIVDILVSLTKSLYFQGQ